MPRSVVLLFIFSLLCMSCRFSNAQPPELTQVLKFEKQFYKTNINYRGSAAFSSDGERFFVSDNYNFISLWKKPFDASEREMSIKEFGKLVSLQVLEDNKGGESLLLSTSDGMLQIRAPDLKTIEFSYNLQNPSYHHVAISPNHRYIAADGELYDRQKKSLVGRGVAHGSYSDVCFGGANLVITSGYHDHGVAIRNVHTGEFEYRRSPHPVVGAAVSPDETVVVTVGRKGRCFLWQLPDTDPTPLVVPHDMHSVHFSPDSKWFVVYGEKSAHIFQTAPPKKLAQLKMEQGLGVLQVVSANLIAMGNQAGEAEIYDVSDRRLIGRQKVCDAGVQHMRLIPEKGLLWAGGCCLGENENKGEIALYRVKGLAPFIHPIGTTK